MAPSGIVTLRIKRGRFVTDGDCMSRRRTSSLALWALVATAVLSVPATTAEPPQPTTAQSASYAGSAERPRGPHRVLRKVRRAANSQPTNAPLPAPAGVSPVLAPPTEHVDAGPSPTAPPASASVGALPTGPHAFLHVEDGVPTRWNPCQPIPWQFNPVGAPAGGLAVVQAAMGTLSERTGLPLRYDGPTSTTPALGYLQQPWGGFRPLLVGWSSSTESDLLAGAPASRVGTARILWTGSYDAQGRNHTQIASGVVVLNRAHVAGTSGPGSWYTFVLHELGHAVGLAHVADDEQIMRASIPGHLETYGAGDLQGLRAVGSGAGCLPSIR